MCRFSSQINNKMVKTEFYVAGGDVIQMSTKLEDCTKICEIEGILYDSDGNIRKWVWSEKHKGYTERIVMNQSDKINSDGVVRRIIFSVGS